MQQIDRTNLLIWRWQRRSAVLLVPFLAFHVIYQYFVVGMDGISFATVSDKLAAAGFLVLDLALLVLVAVHAFAGLRSIFVDYTSSPGRIRTVTTCIGILFLGTIAYAIAALVAFL